MPSDTIEYQVTTTHDFHWTYETDEFQGVCELAGDVMVVKCAFVGTGRQFYDVLHMDEVIRAHLESPVSVERLADNLSSDFPGLTVTVKGRAKTHGWITATTVKRWAT